jgi:hypothetical protein
MHNASERRFYLQCINYILLPSDDSLQIFDAVTIQKKNNERKLAIVMRISLYLQEKSCVPHTMIYNSRHHT